MDIKIIVAAHKDYPMPEDGMYLPLHVGAEGKPAIDGFARDDEGDNISAKNPYYCELTGLYWAWKNLDAQYIGLCHYRRYFCAARRIPKTEEQKFKVVLTQAQAEERLGKSGIILPKPRNYFIETVYNHYKHTMYIQPLDEAGRVIAEKYPEYSAEFERLKRTTRLHAFNMLIMRRDILDSYCKWLFDILGEVEKRVDASQYSDFHRRFFGRISERLLDVWIRTNHLDYAEIPVIDMQSINWANKIRSFLAAKFTGKRYENSF